ncbi:hypothetical protein SAFG77S_08159 [Streptomyces afghaniensis]
MERPGQSRGRRRDPGGRHPPARSLGAGRDGLHHRVGDQRVGHQRHPLRHRADPAADAARPRHPDLRGRRRQQHLTPSASGRHHRRGRTRAVPRRPVLPAVGHPLHGPRQGDLDGAVAPRPGIRRRRSNGRRPAGPVGRGLVEREGEVQWPVTTPDSSFVLFGRVCTAGVPGRLRTAGAAPSRTPSGLVERRWRSRRRRCGAPPGGCAVPALEGGGGQSGVAPRR